MESIKLSQAKACVRALFPGYFLDYWVGHSCYSILDGMRDAGAAVDLTVLAHDGSVSDPMVHGVFPNGLSRFLDGPIGEAAKWFMRRRFCQRMQLGDVAYLWLDSSPALAAQARRRGAFVVREMINCTAQCRAEQFKRAYELLGWPEPKFDHVAAIAEEREQLHASDAVFCPNPNVLKSVLDYGINETACIPCSYGWSRKRFQPHEHAPVPHDGLNVLFVGTVGVRKGVPWLLQAWAKAKLRGTLTLAGPVDSEMSERASHLLDQPSVRVLGRVANVAELYNSADFFVFPTWEEGGPMVTFEAMAHGLPCVVTPMGTAGAVSEREGIIVEPGSVDALAEALNRLASSTELRRELGTTAFETSLKYEWKVVGRQRLAALQAALLRRSKPHEARRG